MNPTDLITLTLFILLAILITKYYFQYKLRKKNQKILLLENKIIEDTQDEEEDEEDDTDFEKLHKDALETHEKCFQILDDMLVMHLQYQIKVEYGLCEENDDTDYLQNIKDSLKQVSKINDEFRLSHIKTKDKKLMS